MSIADSIRAAFVPVHKEGYPFIAGVCRGASLVLGLLWEPLFWIGADAHGLVRLFLPRPAARDAGGRPAGD
jgi:hypothetical protein